MPSKSVVRESRRSTRVHLTVVVEVQGINTPLTSEGETIVVNLHGALMWTSDGPQQRLYTSTPTRPSSAESNWRDRRTFGESLCHRTTGVLRQHDWNDQLV